MKPFMEDEFEKVLKKGELLQIKRANGAIIVSINNVSLAIDKDQKFMYLDIKEEGDWFFSVNKEIFKQIKVKK